MPKHAVDILLVEDNPNDRELALHSLKRHHLANRVQVARDGAEALDFIFGSGAHAGRCLDDRPSIPVVMLTSSSEERDVVESYQLDVNSYIVKPVDFEQFTAAVRQLGLDWVLLNEPPRLPQP
jgi:CheY-like chemotaxis protein